MQRQHGPCIPTVIPVRMAAVTEWVFSLLNRKAPLCVFLIFFLFRWCVGKEGSPLCQATRLKSKVGSGCIWVVCVSVSVWDRGMSTQCRKLPGPMFFYDTPHKQCFLRKNSITAAEFVDSLLEILKPKQKITPLFSSLTVFLLHVFDCTWTAIASKPCL